MSTEQPQRPPASGTGSGVAAWRTYAATITGTPAESWADLSREEIIQRLDGDSPSPDAETAAAGQPDTPAPAVSPRHPMWMVPTEDGGFVAEETLRNR
jgi:hypothetical protein